MMRRPRYPGFAMRALFAVLICGVAAAGLGPALSLAQSNPIVLENQQPGTDAWEIQWGRAGTDLGGEIKGYASATSVNKGQAITFRVSVKPAQTYTIDIYRLGWYQGLGGRLMQHVGPLTGVQQPACPVDATTGLIECQWAPSYSLTTQSSWTSGIYVAVLTNAASFQNYVPFVVRDDSRVATFLYQQPVATYQAYNDYPYDNGGKSLYDFSSFGARTVGGSKAAVKVSFDRPYYGDGDCNVYGHCVLAEGMAFVRWMEKSGYDVSYATDVDLHANGAMLLNYRGFLSAGHDEYWSKEMYDAVIAARNAGVNLGFFSANAIYTQVRFEPSSTGVPNRVMVCYRDDAIDPNTNPSLETVNWRDPPVNRPEQALVGVQYTNQVGNDAQGRYPAYVVTNSSHWVYAGTGLANGSAVSGLVGYEADRLFSEYAQPNAVSGTYTLLSQSAFKSYDGTDYANSSIYQAPSGAWVFAAGTIGWGFALDNYFNSNPYFLDARIAQMTANILARFAGSATPDFSASVAPSSQTIVPGSATSYAVTIGPRNGFTGAVALSVNGLPAGASGSFSPNPATSSATLSVSSSTSTPTGSYTLSVTGISGSLTRSSNSFALTVNAPVGDSTPPVITPVLTGTQGASGWYVTNVSLSWTVTDAQSAVTSTTGCGASSVTTDTTGVTYTCSATSAGGTASQSMTIKRDTSAPTITVTSPVDGASYNAGGNVTASYSCADATSGIPAGSCAGTVANGNAIDLSTTGTQSFVVNATNGAGLTLSRTVTYTVNPASSDSTPPVITPAITGTLGTNGWYISNVTLTWAVTDAESPVTSSTGCGNSSVTSNTAGTTFTCSATSAGGTASQSVTIKRDTTLPTISITRPANYATYALGAVVLAKFSCADALSGLAAGGCVGTVPSGSAIDTGTSGTQTFTVTATDMAGKVRTTTRSYTVQ